MGFLDNFFMADAISRSSDLGDRERDTIMFSADTHKELDALHEIDEDENDYVIDETDPIVLAQKIALLKQSYSFNEPSCRRIRKSSSFHRISTYDSYKLKMQEKILSEISRMEKRLNQILSQPME